VGWGGVGGACVGRGVGREPRANPCFRLGKGTPASWGQTSALLVLTSWLPGQIVAERYLSYLQGYVNDLTFKLWRHIVLNSNLNCDP
jgi:hypothetical protein